MAKQCEMMIGFLVPRQCDQRARSTCIRCGKRICDEHAVVSPEGILCEACDLGVEQLASAESTPDWVSELPDYRASDFDSFDNDDVVAAGSMFDDLS
jgi:hypothetical protein